MMRLQVTDVRSLQRDDASRRGGFMVLAAFCLVAGMGFVSLCVDIGYLSLSKQRLQNGVDAAALAAAMEITNAIQNAGPDVVDVVAYSEAQARQKAVDVAALNGIYLDSARDVVFGRRTDANRDGIYETVWNASPANVVKVTAHRDNPDQSKPDRQLKLFFAGVLGSNSASLVASAAAYVESRDIVCVLDYSGSMNDDSTLASGRDAAALDANMREIYSILDELRDFGDLEYDCEWLTQTASSGEMNGSVVFKNNRVDINASHNITSIKLTYSDRSTSTTNYAYDTNTRSRLDFNSNSKSIDRVDVTVQYQDWGNVASASNTTSSRTANVTFNGTSVTANTSHSMSTIKLVYYPSGSKDFSSSGTSKSVTGNGNYISQVQVKMGSTWVTVNNPNGSRPDIDTEVLVFEDTVSTVKDFFNLNHAWPWASTNNWDAFINYVRTDSQVNSADLRRKYGGKLLVNYLLSSDFTYAQCNDLWRTPHYPFHSLKQGAQLFAGFLDNLDFGDEMGIVSYADTTQTEETLNYDGYNINLSADPICNQFSDFQQIIGHRQAGHYDRYTNIGGGLKQGKMLLDASARPGTKPTILLMTDGLANRRDNSYAFPSNWNWNSLLDYNGDGIADYTTTDSYKRYALGMAKEAVDAGYTIHTLSVGMEADQDLMRAIAHLGRGISIHVPGEQSVAEMEAQVLEAFNRIAAFVPPAKLVAE